MSSRPATPDSPSSLRKATATIDDLTAALSNFSRVPSPEPPHAISCCCGREDCESSKAWAAVKNKLEQRLILSAEVGQALLERHEAYVRRHEPGTLESSISSLQDYAGDLVSRRSQEEVDVRVADLLRENAVLEKRLSQALVNSELVDLTHQNALDELKHAKEKIGQLSAQNARYVGIDSRLAAALQERDDMHQERNGALQTSKLAESRIASLKEKCAKLQAQVGRLREEMEAQRIQRRGYSEDIISEAREKIQQMQGLRLTHPSEDSPVSEVLESLVADNETLKHENAELRNLLSEAREDLRTLQDEIVEHRARSTSVPRYRHHDSIGSSIFDDATTLASPFYVGTAPVTSNLHSMFTQSKAGPSTERRANSSERFSRRGFEPLTPDSTRRPLSPVESRLSASRPSARPRSQLRRLDTPDNETDDSESPVRPSARRSLLLLTRSKAVQTDGTGASASPYIHSPLPRVAGDQLSSHDGQSDSSTLADANPSVIGVLIERVAALHHRMVQADALTLTTRLKRQNLRGADVSHLSRSTVNSVIQESNTLRTQFRAWLEDEKITTTCTRRDLRALFKLFKDMFTELGQLRVTLNDVILDPSVAGKVSDMALHPSKAAANANAEASSGGATTAGWIAPLSKLLGLPGGGQEDTAAARALSPPARPISRGPLRPPPRMVPKREAALSASAMTVNVEFSGAGGARAVTSGSGTVRAAALAPSTSTSSVSPASGDASRSVMDIFAGAPRPGPVDPWVVVSKPARSNTVGGRRYDLAGGATVGRAALRNAANANAKLSRVVDAVIDGSQPEGEERDVLPDTLLQRTLRPRGLSDSSIRTTFLNQEEDNAPAPEQQQEEPERQDRQSVLQALSRRMQSFRQASTFGASGSTPVASTPAPARRSTQPVAAPVPSTSTSGSLFPTLASWAAALDGAEVDEEGVERAPPGVYVPVPREARDDAAGSRAWGRGL